MTGAQGPKHLMDRLRDPKVRCPAPLVSHLSARQQAALHRFLHAVGQSGFELYEHVPAEDADPVIDHFLRELMEQR